jgi:Leucine-rich repeat (LRR) protein
VLDNNVVVVFRQLFWFLVIVVVIISASNAEILCITEETRVQLKTKYIRDNCCKYYFKYVKTLSFSNKQLNWISSQAFAELNNLVTLDLSINRLKHLVKNTFKPLFNLMEIDLSENLLTTISFDEFADKQQLKILNFRFNKIQTIKPIQHQGGFSITALLLYGNNLVDISELCKLMKLEFLQLSSNQNLDFKSFKSTCWNKLQYLYLIDSGLKRLNNDYHIFTGLTKLNQLHLQSNNLEVFCVGNFPELPELFHLDVTDNQLHSLDVNKIKTKFPKLVSIKLTKNLWSCDFFKKLESDLKKLQINVVPVTTEKNCIEGSIIQVESSNLSKCEVHKKEEGGALIIWSLIIIDCVLFLAATFLGYLYFLHRELAKDVIFE